jgi:hypothetical protein
LDLVSLDSEDQHVAKHLETTFPQIPIEAAVNFRIGQDAGGRSFPSIEETAPQLVALLTIPRCTIGTLFKRALFVKQANDQKFVSKQRSISFHASSEEIIFAVPSSIAFARLSSSASHSGLSTKSSSA